MPTEPTFERGSQWRLWDLHIHTPASFHWKGQRFQGDWEQDKQLVDQMIVAINNAAPQVFALMDYWTFDGWFNLNRRLREPDAPKLRKTVFPGIELRLAAPTSIRLNAHAVFSDEIPDQSLKDFRSALKLAFTDAPLSEHALIQYARNATADKLKVHGFKKGEVDNDDKKALAAGSVIAELNPHSYSEAITAVPKEQAIGFMPYDTSDGLAGIKWQDHYAYFLNLFVTSPIFESRNIGLRDAFVNEVTATNRTWIGNFQAELKNIPRLVVSGSDAHQFVGVKGDNNKRGYGDFPVGKETWIKADPTFRGLRQATMEPAKRSFIGPIPPKLKELEDYKSCFIDRLSISKTPNSKEPGAWLDKVELLLNPDLVAVIGNKGSGKSALADVIALLGNSRMKNHFSFLKRDRFRGKSGDPARHFNGLLTWCDASTERRNLSEDPPDDRLERIRYIPHGHFEELCNDHVSGKSNAFERELRSVIFSHASDSTRLGALDFDQLVERQEATLREQLSDLRTALAKLNQEIERAEAQLQPELANTLQQQLAEKRRQVEEHRKTEPAIASAPTSGLSEAEKKVSAELDAIVGEIRTVDERIAELSAHQSALALKAKAVQSIRERFRVLLRAHKTFDDNSQKDLDLLGIASSSFFTLTYDTSGLETLGEMLHLETEAAVLESTHLEQQRTNLLERREECSERLNEPQLTHQKSVKARESWNARLRELLGSADAPETLKGIEARLTQLANLPEILRGQRERRRQIAGEIFDVLDAQRVARARLYEPVQELIEKNSLIGHEYKLQFQATLGGSPNILSSELFGLIKQTQGVFRGDDESHAMVRRMAEQYDFNSRDAVLAFVDELTTRIVEAPGGIGIGISGALRKDKTASDVYNLLFGLSFLAPRYTLLFQGATIEQLSPGQRGSLLLIFYLLVDKGRMPIVLDQPEENLDNQSVVSLLVPVLTEAKKRRQIIMVTHNPNLAVVCDAEQVVYSSFDRSNWSTIRYTSGSIESSGINKHVVNVLEGTKPAFNNRREKYH